MNRLALLAALLAAMPAMAQEITWPREIYNPRPLDGDLVLPMPCGGAMVFRRVETPSRPGALEDRQVVLGSDDEETSYAEYLRTEYLAGSFTDPRSQARYYWIGKYEVTRDQYAVLDGETCPQPTPDGRLPFVGASWYDGVRFGQRYSVWLGRSARAQLPREGEALGFIRLPTDAEWEFAARGGAVVDAAQFRARVFPMSEPMARYVWFQGSQSAQGNVHPVGQLMPNPLGLFDMLGNAAEVILDPYRLTRGDRMHGQAGGFVLRGGDYQTPQARIRASMRLEIPHLNPETGGPQRLPFAGFRVVIAAPLTTSLARTDDLRRAWDELAQRRRLDPQADAVALLDRLIEQAVEPGLRESLQRIKQTLIADRFARDQAGGRAARSAIGAGAVLIRAVRDFDGRVASTRALVAALTIADPNNVRLITRQQQQIEAAENNRALTLRAYVTLLAQTAQDFPPATLTAELAVWRAEQTGAAAREIARFGALFVQQAERTSRDRTPDSNVVLREILE